MARFRRATAMELRGLYGALNQGLSQPLVHLMLESSGGLLSWFLASPRAATRCGSRSRLRSPMRENVRQQASPSQCCGWPNATSYHRARGPAAACRGGALRFDYYSSGVSEVPDELAAPDEIDLAAEVALKIDPERLAWCRRFRRDPTRWRRCLLGQLSTDNG